MKQAIQYNLAKAFGFPRFFAPKSDIQKLINMANDIGSGGLGFEFTFNQRGWIATCRENPCLSTGGTEKNPSVEEINNTVRDAIFAAYDIPAYLCNPNLILSTDEKIQRIRRAQEKRNLQFSFNQDLAYGAG